MYHVSIANLNLELDLPDEFVITKETSPFLITAGSESDERIVVNAVDFLPELPPNGVWKNMRYYTDVEGDDAVFYCYGKERQVYAMIRYRKENQIQYMYKKDTKEVTYETYYLMNMIGLETILLRHQGLILHAAFISWDNHGILFSAPSGTGKSTQANLWKQYKGAKIINGDRAAIRNVKDRWMAYGMPYAGSSGIYCNEGAPIEAIVFLRQGKENRIRRMSIHEALQALLEQVSVHTWSQNYVQAVFDLALELLSKVFVYELECRPDQGAVELLYQTVISQFRE